jgi:hypothetical protein
MSDRTPATNGVPLPSAAAVGARALPTITTPATAIEALQAIHRGTAAHNLQLNALVRHFYSREQPPDMRTVVINPGDNGSYQTIDRASWTASSIGILNPGAAPVYIGIAGVSATQQARAPSCPGGAALVLPVEAGDLWFGCDAATLAAATAVIYVFRYHTLQPLTLGAL